MTLKNSLYNLVPLYENKIGKYFFVILLQIFSCYIFKQEFGPMESKSHMLEANSEKYLSNRRQNGIVTKPAKIENRLAKKNNNNVFFKLKSKFFRAKLCVVRFVKHPPPLFLDFLCIASLSRETNSNL